MSNIEDKIDKYLIDEKKDLLTCKCMKCGFKTGEPIGEPCEKSSCPKCGGQMESIKKK